MEDLSEDFVDPVASILDGNLLDPASGTGDLNMSQVLAQHLHADRVLRLVAR